MVTPMSARTYSESTDQEMDIWLKLTLSPSSSVIKTVSFTVTPFLISCGGKHLGYRKCGKAGHCIREQFFCDGTVSVKTSPSKWKGILKIHNCYFQPNKIYCTCHSHRQQPCPLHCHRKIFHTCPRPSSIDREAPEIMNESR